MSETTIPQEDLEELADRLREYGDMVLEDELNEECHPYGHGLLDAADAVEGVIDDA